MRSDPHLFLASSRKQGASMSRPWSQTGRRYLSRALNWSQMDWDYAVYQMTCLASLAPSKLYRATRYHRRTKKQWSRDDPAFLVLFLSSFFMTCFLYGLVYSGWSVKAGFRLAASQTILWFGIVALVFSSLYVVIANRFLADPTAGYSSESWMEPESPRVEWMYALDVYCNALFGGVFLPLYVMQGVLLRFLVRSRFASCALYLFSNAYFWYISWLGYDILPFLRRTQLLLVPIPSMSAVMLAATFLGEVNFSQWTWRALHAI
ncbi:hypothetical protein, conserved [Cyanidioschyzon merolae strain 10D]|uniref:UNC-50 family protein n=1 Tax=Cyanidioschyzon merolae (strain NIES-3377 / 10D) TaxID=280699 RepID=M1V781_CYAM1|nr:hypothetical protein, conserved [Cyanidioschyzon merolae strain 10D]BAM79579.1 hypothetical protein, conserved [Cyanidioschyzon merolae strain 10D]|eukprot:XP_005535865.1 hypothetical protein, conserved [Cyanidioschyzon merolae strain 10D]